jgi:HAD superfamily hydrolase (TIGR01458 family)
MMAIKAVILDLSGVLYEGTTALPGSVTAVKKLRDAGYVLRFATNTAQLSAQQIIQQLHNIGFEVQDNELFSAPLAARDYAQAQKLNPFCLVHKNIKPDFHCFQSTAAHDAVIIADAGDDLNYANLNYAFQLCQAGAPLIAVGNNRYYMANGKLQLDVGAFVQGLAFASGQQPLIMGKPDAAFFHTIVRSTGYSAGECLMVGDDALNDIQGALDAGLQACLVQSGKYQSGDEQQIHPAPLIKKNLLGLVSYLSQC